MLTQTGFIPCGQSVVTLCVTSYRERCLKGNLSSASLDGNLAFQSTIELLCLLEHLMDQAKFPQRSEESRAFQPAAQAPGGVGRATTGEKVPVIACFQVNVMFRQNATWQGSLFWVDRGLEANFRSVLELLNLINSAFSSEAGEAV